MTGVLGPARQRRLSFFVLIKDVFLRAADCLLWVSRWVTPIFRWVGGGFLPFSGGLTVGFRFWGIFWKKSGLWIFQAEKPHCARRIHRRCGESTVAAENPQPLRRIHSLFGESTSVAGKLQPLRKIHNVPGESTVVAENPQPLRRIHNVRQKIYQACGKSTNVSENPQLNRRNHNAPGKPPYAWRIHDRSGKSTAPTENPQSQQKIHNQQKSPSLPAPSVQPRFRGN